MTRLIKRQERYGDCGEVVNTTDCGSVIRGFDSHQSPHRKQSGSQLTSFFYIDS